MATAVVSGTVVANTAIGRLEPSMLDTATTSSITNTSMMSELVRSSAGWTRLIVQASPNRRSSTTKVSRARLIAVSLAGCARNSRHLTMLASWIVSTIAIHNPAQAMLAQ